MKPEEADKEEDSPECEFDSHRYPYSLQAIALGKSISQSEAHQPHGTEIDHRRFSGIAPAPTQTQ